MVLAYEDFMDKAAERIGGDFYLLPSSIHELVLVPDNGGMNSKELGMMVQSINMTEVLPEERLTDSAYHYDARNHIFELAEKFEARQSELASNIDKKDRGKDSLIKNLKDKQREVKSSHAKDSIEKVAKSKDETR